MKAFNNNKELKQELLIDLLHHQNLDAFIQGLWLTHQKVEGNRFKGCFYGCTMQTSDNPVQKFSEKYNVDLWYCHITEKIFENLPDREYQTFPFESISIVPVGFDFNLIKSQFHRSILLKQLEWVTDEKVIQVINQCADLFSVPFDQIDRSTAAWGAAKDAADSAARSALWSVASAMSARSALWSVASAMSARSAAWSVANAAWSAGSTTANAAESAAVESNYYVRIKEFLFNLIKENTK